MITLSLQLSGVFKPDLHVWFIHDVRKPNIPAITGSVLDKNVTPYVIFMIRPQPDALPLFIVIRKLYCYWKAVLSTHITQKCHSQFQAAPTRQPVFVNARSYSLVRLSLFDYVESGLRLQESSIIILQKIHLLFRTQTFGGDERLCSIADHIQLGLCWICRFSQIMP